MKVWFNLVEICVLYQSIYIFFCLMSRYSMVYTTTMILKNKIITQLTRNAVSLGGESILLLMVTSSAEARRVLSQQTDSSAFWLVFTKLISSSLASIIVNQLYMELISIITSIGSRQNPVRDCSQVLGLALDKKRIGEPSVTVCLIEELIFAIYGRGDRGQWGVWTFLADGSFISLLLGESKLVVVEAGPLAVHVGELWDVDDSVVGHFEAGNHCCHVVGHGQELPFAVLEVLLLDLPDQGGVHGPEMAGDEGILSIGIFFDYSGREGLGVAEFSLFCEEIGVDYPSTGLLIDCVVQFEHLPAYQLIVSINNHEDLLRAAFLLRCLADVPRTANIFLILYDFIVFRFDLCLFIEIFLDLITGAIGGGVIDDHYVVILVILHDDRLDVAQVAVAVEVVEGGDDDTEGQFFVLADVVYLFVVLLFFLGELGVHEEVFVFEVAPSRGLHDFGHADTLY